VTAIGSTTPANTSGGTVAPLPNANASSYTFYWTAPGSSLSTTYQYTMSATDADGNVATSPWSPTATASFNVSGPPAVSVTPSGQQFFIGSNPPAMNWGIKFNATVNSPAPGGYSGTYTWIQLVQSFVYTWIYSDGSQPTPCTYTPGFDAGPKNEFPYATGLSSADGPLVGLNVPPTYSQVEQTQSAQFQMYLLWNPNTGSGSGASIPVTLGSIVWNTAGDVVWNPTNQTWKSKSGTTNATTNGNFALSYTYPKWQNPATQCQ
jgi:hypothetical protein